MKILFLGTHGQYNIGDELLLETFLSQLGSEHRYAVNSYDPPFTLEMLRPRFQAETFHTTRELPRFLGHLLTSNLLFFGGGSIIKEWSRYATRNPCKPASGWGLEPTNCDILVHKVASRYPTPFFYSPNYPPPIVAAP